MPGDFLRLRMESRDQCLDVISVEEQFLVTGIGKGRVFSED